ncbi:hypothetical protein FGO68_gene16372 [Halteria grandinella]|uniref:UBC core domain-containing protein n=1 Tax=Halteria grandinella TaxID=5974 RepID=A0A8J8SYC1_HALGN|nr:hypothetical protein FGO68_gene16372 [Halteria grandinella]
MASTPGFYMETQSFKEDPIAGIYIEPSATNNHHFYVKMAGPSETPYEGGLFNIELFIPNDYPMAPPKVLFRTKIFHPNIDSLGRIDLGILRDKWSPAFLIKTVLLAIKQLLQEPTYDCRLNHEYCNLWEADPSAAFKKAREWTETYANE